jgi:hypothetical protein
MVENGPLRSPGWLTDALLRQALELAALAHDDIERVRQILDAALDLLETSQDGQEQTLVDRLKRGRRPTKLVLLGPPLLHRLILEQSDALARQLEGDTTGQLTEDRMAPRYLQHLVLLVLQRSSRWAALGIGQLVYAYRGSEVRRMVGRIKRTYYPDRKRKANKQLLMQLLRDRFPGLQPVAAHGGVDAHFKPRIDQDRCGPAVVRYLETLAPWEAESADWEELTRCRIFIRPDSFELLVAALGFTRPHETLRFPQVLR